MYGQTAWGVAQNVEALGILVSIVVGVIWAVFLVEWRANKIACILLVASTTLFVRWSFYVHPNFGKELTVLLVFSAIATFIIDYILPELFEENDLGDKKEGESVAKKEGS